MTFEKGVTTACSDCALGPLRPRLGFNVTFVDVVGAAGEMHVMTAAVHGLKGNRRADVKRVVRGQAGLGGTFRLSFRGFTTADIHHNASAAEEAGALRQLDSIPYDGGGGGDTRWGRGLRGHVAPWVGGAFGGRRRGGHDEPGL